MADYSIPQIETRPIPGVRLDPRVPYGSFGQEVGTTIQQIGGMLATKAAQMQDEDNRNAAMMAFNKANTAASLQLNGFEDKPGILSLEGRNAIGSTSSFVNDLEEIERLALEEIKNPAAQGIFRQNWAQRKSTLIDEVSSYEAAQRKIARDEYVVDALRAAKEMVAAAPESIETVNQANQLVLDAFVNNQKSPIETENALRNVAETAREALIARMIDEDPGLARRLLRDETEFEDMDLITRLSHIKTARAADIAQQKQKWERRLRLEEAAAEYPDRIRSAAVDEAIQALDPDMPGHLTSEWIVDKEQRNLIDPELATWLWGELKAKTRDKEGNPIAYAQLHRLAIENDPAFHGAAVRSLMNGEISVGWFNTLNTAYKQGPMMSGILRTGLDQLEEVFAVEAQQRGSLGRTAGWRQTQAVQSYLSWARENPKATVEETDQKVWDLLWKHSSRDPDKMVELVEQPRARVGPISNPNVEETLEAINALRDSGAYSQQEYEEDLIRWNRMKKAVDARTAAKEAAEARRKKK